MKRGGAKPGDKTMIDALAPAAEEAGKVIGKPLPEALAAVAAAAEAGKDASKAMVAQFGRAKTLGDACIGFPDAGACSIDDHVVSLSQSRIAPTGTVGNTPSSRSNTCMPKRSRLTVVPSRLAAGLDGVGAA